ncbi:hypothetical protein ACSBR1_035512 [Camellia fascicularis]
MKDRIQVGGSRFRRNTFVNHKFGGIPFLPNDPSSSSNVILSSTVTLEEDPIEDCDFFDAVLTYISQILMEKDMEDKSCMLQESLDLQAAEKPFCDVLGKKYPLSPEKNPIYVDQSSESPDDCLFRNHITSSNSVNKNIDGFMDSPISPLQEPNGETSEVVKVEKKEKKEYSPNESKGRKNPHRERVDLEEEKEERSSKQPAVYLESTLQFEMFYTVLLCSIGKGEASLIAYRKALKDGTSKKMQQNGKGCGKKQNRKKEVVDLRTLLIHCAQVVAADDRRSSSELLKQIRQHSSPWGDRNQRLAHCFANGLEARLAGTGSQIYKAFVSRRTSAANYLKAYHLYLASCPFRKISNFVSNRTITMNGPPLFNELWQEMTDKDEFLVVNCLYRSKNLPDETVLVDSSRNIVINLIRRINPDLFIHGIVNGAYSAPFFVTWFRGGSVPLLCTF